MTVSQKIGVIGLGKMGMAILDRLVSHPSYCLSYYNPSPRTGILERSVVSYPTITQLITQNDILFLCTPPSQTLSVLKTNASNFCNKTVISVVAGMSLQTLRSVVDANCKMIRTMPNTPCRIGQGVVAYTSCHTQPYDRQMIHSLLSRLGYIIEVDESLIDPIAGLSGSGPAYVCLFIEALADAGVRAGISRELSYKLACHTLLGTAKMILDTNIHPGILKDEVSSPAGATIEGIFHLEQSGLRSSVMQAVLASVQKCKQLMAQQHDHSLK